MPSSRRIASDSATVALRSSSAFFLAASITCARVLPLDPVRGRVSNTSFGEIDDGGCRDTSGDGTATGLAVVSVVAAGVEVVEGVGERDELASEVIGDCEGGCSGIMVWYMAYSSVGEGGRPSYDVCCVMRDKNECETQESS
jgi:hypothetical protein